jgi:hypothetical protein
MNQINTAGLAHDIARELEDMHAAASRAGVRVLQEMELGWVGGGDPVPEWGGTPPGP